MILNAELQLRRDIRACRACHLGYLPSGPVPPWFPDRWREPRVLVVGEAPGREEARRLRPFIGPSGSRLRAAMGKVGMDTERVGWANVVACWPCRKEVAPVEGEVRACGMNLANTLAVARARYVLVVGDVASRAFGYGDGSMAEKRGKWKQVDDVALFCTYHPSYVLRNPIAERVWEADLAEFAFYSLGVFRPEVEEEVEKEIKGAKVQW